MLRTLCKSKIINARITGKIAEHGGSVGIDKNIMAMADILPGEQVHIFNMNNGARFITYAIEEPEDSGKIVLYGPAVRKGETGDGIVILSYCMMETAESNNFKMHFIELGKNNQLKGKK